MADPDPPPGVEGSSTGGVSFMGNRSGIHVRARWQLAEQAPTWAAQRAFASNRQAASEDATPRGGVGMS